MDKPTLIEAAQLAKDKQIGKAIDLIQVCYDCGFKFCNLYNWNYRLKFLCPWEICRLQTRISFQSQRSAVCIKIHFSHTVAWITALKLWVSVWQCFLLTSFNFNLITAVQNLRFHDSCSYFIFTFQTQVSKATDVSMNLKLTLAQLHLAQGSVFQACDTLKNLGNLSYAPGIVSMLCCYFIAVDCHLSDKFTFCSLCALGWHKASILCRQLHWLNTGSFSLHHLYKIQSPQFLMSYAYWKLVQYFTHMALSYFCHRFIMSQAN